MDRKNIVAQVQRLRMANASIRDIVRILSVSKYTVEKILKELEETRLRTIHLPVSEDATPPATDAVRPVADTDQTVADSSQKPQQTGINTLLSRVDALLDGTSTEEKEPEKAEKQLYSTYFFDVMRFLSDYKKLMVLLQRDVSQERKVWLHVVNEMYLKELARLQQEAWRLSRRDDREYERMQLTQVLEACEAYLRNVLLTPEAHGSILTLRWVTLPKDEQILALCRITFSAEDPFVYTLGCQAAA